MLTVIRKEIQIMLREKGTFFWLIALPIVFILIFGSIFGKVDNQKITLRYLDQDNSGASRELLQSISKIKGFDLKTDKSLTEKEQIKKIKDGKQSSLLVIPKGFARKLELGQARLNFYRDATSDSAVAPIQAVLQNLATGYREGKITGVLGATVQDKAKVNEILQPPLKINEIRENAKKINMITQIVPGYTVMFAFFILINMTRSFVKEKESGMLARLRSTPMKPMNYLMGMWVSAIIVVLIQCATLLSFGRFAYKLSLGDIPAMVVIVLSLAICGTGLGLALSMLVKSENQGVAFTQVFVMGGAALGGLWVPYDIMPPLMQTIGKFTPQYWAQKAFQDIMIRGAKLGDVWQAPLILLAIGVIGLIIGLLRFNSFIDEATN